MPRVHPCFWFDHQAEEAAAFYVSIFPNSKVHSVLRYDQASAKESGRPAGSVLTVDFEIDGQRIMALNGGPAFKLTEAASLVVECRDQKDVDAYWAKLSAGGEESQCGWLKDKYGLSWQIVPDVLAGMLLDKDPKKSERVMTALLKMKKLDIAVLKKAYEAR